MGSESRLKPGRVVGAMPAIASLMGWMEGRERGAHDLMDYGVLWIGCVIRVYNIYSSRLANGICLFPAA